ncbi:S9 family peptidase [Undibacterium sp. LX40W]|uniref:S9 family peptidase n=1 Tax=Undibacterium nitidum TaxID=2762298 RepID=A0A923HV69_9BURK|nr:MULTISPECIES: S9 family peptidase [Undibacterium]MBC3880706.1 S9 family peptidase [Undibacterium nitidum]MBC3890559.1 S9 family peptidase [Undibacterium sp. LX40W]
MKIKKISACLLIAGSLMQMGFMANVAAQAPTQLSLEKIMSNTDWMGIAPERSYFSADGKYVYFLRKADGSEVRDTYRVPVAGGPAVKLSASERVSVESEQVFFSPDRSYAAWLRNGNLFVIKDGKKSQISRTGDMSGLLGFVGHEQLAFRQDGKVNLFNLRSGETVTLVNIKNDDDPAAKKDNADYLTLQQTRLFDIIKKRETDKKEVEARQHELASQSSSAPLPIYLGKGREFRSFSLSPDGKHILLSTSAPRKDGRNDKMPHYVSADGYTKIDDVRSKVGTGEDANEFVYLIDIAANKAQKLNLEKLAGINEDPLLDLKKDAAKRLGKAEPKAAVPRAVYVGFRGARWSLNGQKVAFQLFSADNKDRWILQIDTQNKEKDQWQLVHRLTDKAWVNDGDFNEMLWSRDHKTLWFLSEETGYSQLYTYQDAQVRAITSGKYEMNRIQASRDGRWVYYRANKKHPGKHEIYRLSTDGKIDEALTDMNGGTDYELSPNEDRLLLTHSSITRQPDLFVQATSPQAKATRLTDSTSKEFGQINWIVPDVVAVPSKHGAAPIYSRVYQDTSKKTGEKKPAVMFVHGAGYLQAAHYGWSNYFREMMFHNLLVQEGYVVIDMDYRASAGYGRDWRNAIYQRMGTPELEDYLDGIDWLVENANVDRQRVGIYGGSYGGFMTFMAMFKTDAFAAGAALRPVADWAHYNHGYTSNILNTPDVDPDAYLRSSPIEFAAGLKRPLLICSGILDDNVFFQDSVRMVQKLIELKNPNFEFAVYPIEPHGFREPTSWLDEYRRIFKLMEKEVKGRDLKTK